MSFYVGHNKMRHVMFVALVTLLADSGLAAAQVETRPMDGVAIKPNAVSVPLKYIVLAKRGNEYCAMQLLTHQKGAGKNEWGATYESYFQDNMSGKFTDKNTKYRKDELIEKEPIGIGRLAANRSQTTVFCGKLKLSWTAPAWIYPYVSYSEDRTVMLAPTKWKDIADVNYLDSRLSWYGYDEKRSEIVRPVEKLW